MYQPSEIFNTIDEALAWLGAELKRQRIKSVAINEVELQQGTEKSHAYIASFTPATPENVNPDYENPVGDKRHNT